MFWSNLATTSCYVAVDKEDLGKMGKQPAFSTSFWLTASGSDSFIYDIYEYCDFGPQLIPQHN